MLPDRLGLVSLLILIWNAAGSLEGESFEGRLRPEDPVKPSILTGIRCTHGLLFAPSPKCAICSDYSCINSGTAHGSFRVTPGWSSFLDRDSTQSQGRSISAPTRFRHTTRSCARLNRSGPNHLLVLLLKDDIVKIAITRRWSLTVG